MNLAQLCAELRESRGIAHKQDILAMTKTLELDNASAFSGAIRAGDDCAAIPIGDTESEGYLLLAIEGFINDFVDTEPWFAGWCGVMVNVSDIYAMGGRPLAVVDALWSRGAAHEKPILEGLRAAAQTYAVPIVGGHTNSRNAGGQQLAVAILGRAKHLLSSFDARPGDRLLAAIDLRGAYHEPHVYWDAATRGASAERLRGDLEILPSIAEAGLCKAAKDISMGGLIGTALMLLECSGVGATIALSAVPRPVGVPYARWLQSFPSYGFLLSVAPEHVETVKGCFTARDIACADIGSCDGSTALKLMDDLGAVELFRDLKQEPLMGFGPALHVGEAA